MTTNRSEYDRAVAAARREAVASILRKRTIRIMRVLIAAGVFVIVVAAFALGVVLLASGI